MNETQINTSEQQPEISQSLILKQKKKINAFVQFLFLKRHQMHNLNFNQGQRKNRKNRRRAFAAGKKNAFN